MSNWYFTIDELVARSDWFIMLVYLRVYATETMEIGNRRKYIIPLKKINRSELAAFTEMSRPTIQRYVDGLPLGEYAFPPLLGRTLEYDGSQLDSIIAAAKKLNGGARNEFTKVAMYVVGLLNKHNGIYSHALKQFAAELELNYSTVQRHIEASIAAELFERSLTGNSFSGESSTYSFINH